MATLAEIQAACAPYIAVEHVTDRKLVAVSIGRENFWVDIPFSVAEMDQSIADLTARVIEPAKHVLNRRLHADG